MTDKPVSKISTIKRYFGYRAGESAKDFMQEMKALTADDRLELAQGAAKALGLTKNQVDFPLS